MYAARDPSAWRLTVDGLVQTPLALSLDELEIPKIELDRLRGLLTLAPKPPQPQTRQVEHEHAAGQELHPARKQRRQRARHHGIEAGLTEPLQGRGQTAVRWKHIECEQAQIRHGQ